MKEYYNWIRQIKTDKTNVTLRLAFCDWCNENGHPKAANRQRMAIDAINNAYCIYMILVDRFYSGHLTKDKIIEHYGRIQSGRDNKIKTFKLNDDGTVTYRHAQDHQGTIKRLVKGTPKAPKKINYTPSPRMRKLNSAFKALKNPCAEILLPSGTLCLSISER